MTKYTKMGGGGGFNHHHNYAPYLQPFSYKGAKRINGSFLFIIIVQGNGLQEIFGVLPRGRSASRWMGAAIPYWCFTTQTSQKAGSAFDFHTKSWFRVSSKPLNLHLTHPPNTSGHTQIHNFRHCKSTICWPDKSWIHGHRQIATIYQWSGKVYSIKFGFLMKLQEFLFIRASLGFPGS